MKIYLELFLIFFKIGSFTLGGGYAMIPLIQSEIVLKKGWIKEEEFLDMLALAQSSPGALAINVAIFVGYKIKGIKGILITVLGGTLPSVIIIWSLAKLFDDFKNNIYIIKSFKGIRPMIVGLISVSVYNLSKGQNFNKYKIMIVFLVAVLISYLKIPPILIIVFGGILGNIFIKIKEIKNG